MNTSSTDSIRKEITVNASTDRVWRALTVAGEFGRWFGVDLDGSFEVGTIVTGRITHPGCETLRFECRVEQMDTERLFAFRWQPQGERGVDWSGPTTLVEFHVEAVDGGTRVTVTESGFDALPAERREELFSRNEGGWEMQVENLRKHVDG